MDLAWWEQPSHPLVGENSQSGAQRPHRGRGSSPASCGGSSGSEEPTWTWGNTNPSEAAPKQSGLGRLAVLPLQDGGKVLNQSGILCSCSEQLAADLMRTGDVHQHCGNKKKKKQNHTTSHTSFYVIILKLYGPGLKKEPRPNSINIDHCCWS